MTDYTTFEAQLLVGCYLVGEDTGQDIVPIQAVFERFYFEPKANWIDRAVAGLTQSGMSTDMRTMASSLEQEVWLNAHGIKQAELLLNRGIKPALGRSPILGAPNNTLSETPVAPESLVGAYAFIPASDRVVRLTDNQSEATNARLGLSNLGAQLNTANDIGGFSLEEIEEAKREVWLLQQELNREAIRVDWIESMAKACLKWIAVKSAEQIVGALALAALAAIAALIGFSV